MLLPVHLISLMVTLQPIYSTGLLSHGSISYFHWLLAMKANQCQNQRVHMRSMRTANQTVAKAPLTCAKVARSYPLCSRNLNLLALDFLFDFAIDKSYNLLVQVESEEVCL